MNYCNTESQQRQIGIYTMETLRFKLNKVGYIFDNSERIEKITYADYLREFGGDETTTPLGVAPRLFLDGKYLCTWGITGNNRQIVELYKSKKEARKNLFYCFEQYIENKNWDAPRFFVTKKELYKDLSEKYEKSPSVIKRFFSIQKGKEKLLRQTKIKYDNRPSYTVDMMKIYILENHISLSNSLKDLRNLKNDNNKELWHIKANSLVQMVSHNDFRILKWKDIFNLIVSEIEFINNTIKNEY